MKVFIPYDMVIRAHRVKYRYLAIPFLVIILNFILSLVRETLYVPYVSMIAFVIFMFIMYIFRFKRTFSEVEGEVVIAPMNGKIVDIRAFPEGNVITIIKSLWASSEFTTCTKSDIQISHHYVLELDVSKVSWKVDSAIKHIFIDETVDVQAALIGLVPWNAVCEVFLPEKYKLKIEKGNAVVAGETVIGNH